MQTPRRYNQMPESEVEIHVMDDYLLSLHTSIVKLKESYMINRSMPYKCQYVDQTPTSNAVYKMALV